MAKAKGKGRRKGSRNKGYFYRKGRGWYVKAGSQFIALTGENGERLRDRDTPEADVKAAYARYQLDKPGTKNLVPAGTATVMEVCVAYLAKAKEEKGENKTFSDRAETLFDFCFGLPARFLDRDPQPKGKPTKETLRTKGKPTKEDKTHPGYGGMAASKLTKLDVDKWLQAHPTWKGGKRSKIKAVVRALNYGVECELLTANPVKGYKTPKPIGRVTYLEPAQEDALCKAASPALAMAIRVLVRTGMRPGCEFAAMTARHVKDHGSRMEIVFGKHESKTGKVRTIYVTDAETIATIRKQVKMYPSNLPIFRTHRDEPWTASNLSKRFREVRKKLADNGMEFDKDTCLYSTRHTYARRILHGHWNGRATNIETLSKLMGNSPQICREHYLQWDRLSTDLLWQNA